MVFDTGSPVCSLSAGVIGELRTLALLRETGQSYGASPVYRLEALSVEGQPLPEMDVHKSNRATLLRIDGVIGLDYMTKFRRISFDVEALRMTLTV
jgi:hypothetical protein